MSLNISAGGDTFRFPLNYECSPKRFTNSFVSFSVSDEGLHFQCDMGE